MALTNILFKNKFIKNSFVYITGNIFAGFLGYLFHLLISRKLTVENYGELQALVSLLSILAVPTAAINFFIIKHVSAFFAKKDYLSNWQFYKWLNKNIFKIIIILSLCFLLAMPLLNNYLHLKSYVNLLLVWVIVILGLLIVIQRGVLHGWQKFIHLSFNNIFNSAIKLIAGVALVYVFATTFSALLGFLLAAIFSYLYLKNINKNINKPLNTKNQDKADKLSSFFDPKKIKQEIKRIILPILFFTLMINMLSFFDMLMVKNIADPQMAGFYGAFNILGKIIFWAASSVVAVILPIACANNSLNKPLSKKTIFYANGLIIAICLIGLIVYLLFPQFLISLLLGSQYLPVAGSLWIFALMALALSLLTLEANLAYSRYDFRISYILLLTLIVEIILVYLFHASIFQIALMITLAQFFGYFASLFFNIFLLRNKNLNYA